MNATKPIAISQKFSIWMTVIIGIAIILLYKLGITDQGTLTLAIFFYCLGVSVSFLVFESFVDLNEKKVYNIWLLIGIAQFIAYLLTRDDLSFQFYNSANFNPNRGLNLYISDMATSSLKTLLVFLLAYKFFNWLMFQFTGNIMLNAFNQTSYTHSFTQRNITWLDITFNILLLAIILVSSFIY